MYCRGELFMCSIECLFPQLLPKRNNTLAIILRHFSPVFKSHNSLNPPCLNDIFSKKCVPYLTRDSCMREQLKRKTTTFGLRSFSYVGVKVWDGLTTYLYETTGLNDFKSYWIPGMDQIL